MYEVGHLVDTMTGGGQQLREHRRVILAFQKSQLQVQSVALTSEAAEEPRQFAPWAVATHRKVDRGLSAVEGLFQPEPELEHLVTGAPAELGANSEGCAVESQVATNPSVKSSHDKDQRDVGRDDGGREGDEQPPEFIHDGHRSVSSRSQRHGASARSGMLIDQLRGKAFIGSLSSSSFMALARTTFHRQGYASQRSASRVPALSASGRGGVQPPAQLWECVRIIVTLPSRDGDSRTSLTRMAEAASLARAWIGTLVFLFLAPGVVAGFIPWLISGWRRYDWDAATWLVVPIAWIAIGAGVVFLVQAFALFAVHRGTPAPVAPTQTLVVTGVYRFVRNPMYLSVLTIILGQALLLGSWWLVVYAGIVLTAVLSFVKGYEEPTLARAYGEQYLDYRRNVPGWWPRYTPWDGRV